MSQIRRALLYQAKEIIRPNINLSCLSTISHKNQGTTTPEETSKHYKTTTRRGDYEDTKMYEEQKHTAAESAKTAAVGAMEMGLKLGKMAKQTMEGVLDAAEKTTESVRDSVADDIDDDGPGPSQGRCRVPDDHIEEQSHDKFVEDLRRRARGYDLDDRR